jgi:hypothetical protein
MGKVAQSGLFTGRVDHFGLSICFEIYFLLNNIFNYYADLSATMDRNR